MAWHLLLKPLALSALAFLSFSMTCKPFVLVWFALAVGWAVPSIGHAHHGPPHEEIDEFDTPAARLAVPAPEGGVSWPALFLSAAGVLVAFAAARRWGLEAGVPAAVRVRR
jgi:hypothetical protein